MAPNDCLLNELRGPREPGRRHSHLPDAGHVLTIVVAQEREHPRDHLGEAVLWDRACNYAKRLPFDRPAEATSPGAMG
jgi:hypothetical protein